MYLMNKSYTFITLLLAVAVFVGCGSLSKAVIYNDLDEVKYYITKGADVNRYDSYGWTPIMWATYYNYYDLTAFLMNNGADINVRTAKAYGSVARGSTPLIIASYYGWYPIARELIKRGADKFVINGDGYTALELAKKYGFEDVAELMDAKDKTGKSEK